MISGAVGNPINQRYCSPAIKNKSRGGCDGWTALLSWLSFTWLQSGQEVEEPEQQGNQDQSILVTLGWSVELLELQSIKNTVQLLQRKTAKGGGVGLIALLSWPSSTWLQSGQGEKGSRLVTTNDTRMIGGAVGTQLRIRAGTKFSLSYLVVDSGWWRRWLSCLAVLLLFWPAVTYQPRTRRNREAGPPVCSKVG